MFDTSFSPSQFVAVFNQTLGTAYPSVVIEGELSELRIAKNRWLYFKLKDSDACVNFFGSVQHLPGPLADGLMLRVVGVPRLHQRYGFSVNTVSITPIGAGSLKKAADMLAKKLAAEGLFAPERKRRLPELPQRIGLITAAGSAAYADFVKVLNERWGGLEVLFADSYVQGDQAPLRLVAAIEQINRLAQTPDVLVITRGGGSLEDLAAFNDERLVRAVAASRAPTLVAIGHETDWSLAEMAADARASTPSNAAQLVVPDRRQSLSQVEHQRRQLSQALSGLYAAEIDQLAAARVNLTNQVKQLISVERQRLAAWRRLTVLFDPRAALRRGYAIVRRGVNHIASTKSVASGDRLSIELRDGKISATVEN